MCGRSRFLGVALLAAGLAGCVTYPSTYYAPGDPNAGGGDYYFDERYDDGYGGAYGYVEPYSSGYASGWPVYYSTLWPVYRNYYDPFWSPGFYYGVTWFPSTYFGLGIGGWDAWPYYTHYSPYRYAFWDSYYDWYNPWWHGGGHHGHGHGSGRWRGDDWDDRDDNGWRDPPRGGGGPRFGSARNEAERLARIDGVGASPGKVDGYGAYGSARGATSRNWRGTPPAGALSQSGNAGETPLSNADLLGRSRFASRPGSGQYGGAQPGYRDNAGTGQAPGTAPANPRGIRGEVQRPGSASGYPAPDRANAYRQPRGGVPQAADPATGWVGPAQGSRPTGRYEQRPYEQRAPATAGQPAPRSYGRQMPQPDGYAPIEGSAGGSSRWRSAPSSAPAPAAGQSWDRPSGASRGYPQGRSGYPAQGRPPAPPADYPATRSQPSPRYESRPQSSGGSQPRYQAPPQRYEAPPRRESPPPRQESRDRSDSHNDSGGGSSSESSRFSRGGRDRED